jgi:hypothetical protein
MSVLWRVGYVTAAVLGLVYLAVPERVHRFGFESLRLSGSDRPGERDRTGASDAPLWLYRGLGLLLLFVGATGLL